MADDEWIPFASAVQMISRRLNRPIVEAESLIRAEVQTGNIHVAPDLQLRASLESLSRASPLCRPNQLATEFDSALDMLAEAARQTSLDATLGRHPMINRADLLNWRDQRTPEKSILKLAPDAVIEGVIAAVYDDADKGAPRPNINELPKAVLPRLGALGYRTSQRRIKRIGGAEKFASRRHVVGKRHT
jgi:hypothetical protein